MFITKLLTVSASYYFSPIIKPLRDKFENSSILCKGLTCKLPRYISATTDIRLM